LVLLGISLVTPVVVRPKGWSLSKHGPGSDETLTEGP
jgi:hypothetical protein